MGIVNSTATSLNTLAVDTNVFSGANKISRKISSNSTVEFGDFSAQRVITLPASKSTTLDLLVHGIIVTTDQPVLLAISKATSVVINKLFVYYGDVNSITLTNNGTVDATINFAYVADPALPVPLASFAFTPNSGIMPLTVRFADTSTNTPTSWQWSFGDGGSSTEQNPTYTYAAAGTYNVSLVATNSVGTDTYVSAYAITVASSSVVVAPVANFAEPADGVAPNAVTFTDLSTNNPTSWLWDFGDGNTSTAQNPTHTYLYEGSYIPSLTATNSAGSNTFAGYTIAVTATLTISSDLGNVVTPLNNNAGLTVTGSGFTPDTVLYIQIDRTLGGVDNSLTTTYRSDMNGNISTDISIDLSAAGTHTVVASVGTTTSNTLTIQAVASTPVASYSSSASSGEIPFSVTFTDTSTNNPTSWLWIFGDGTTSTLQNPSHTFNLPADYSVILEATNSGGTNSVTHTISATTIPPAASFTSTPTSGTAPLEVTFTDTSLRATAWLWDFGDGNTSTAQNPTHTYTTSAIYTVSLTATNAAGSNTYTAPSYLTVMTQGVSFALHGTGTAGSQTFTDSLGLTTWGGTAVIAETPSKFGGGSIYISGTLPPNSYLSTTSTGIYAPCDWTYDLWMNIVDFDSWSTLYGDGSGALGDNNGVIRILSNAAVVGGVIANPIPTITTNTWHFFAVCYNHTTSTATLYNDGVLIATITGVVWNETTSGAPTIGRAGPTDNSGELHAYLNDVRMTRGIIRYTSNFTPPTAPFTV